MSMWDNYFGTVKACIAISDFEAAQAAFIAIAKYKETSFIEDNFSTTRVWGCYYGNDWEWKKFSTCWKLVGIGHHNSPDTIMAILEAIAPFLSDISVIRMGDNNNNDFDRSFIRFVVKNGVVYQQNADDYWPS